MTPAQEAFLLGNKPREELYDLDTDPWEVNNLAANPAHASLLEDHRRILSDQMLKTGDFRAHASVLLGDIAAGTSVSTVENASAQLLADSDGDGFNTYFEALLGLNPGVQDDQHATAIALQPDGEVAYTVRNLRDGFRYTVQISTDLDDWQPFTTLEGASGGSPSVVTLPAGLSEPDRALFVRLFVPQ